MTIRRRIASLAVAGLVAALGVAASASPASAATYYIIQNNGSGLCLQPPPQSPTSIGVQLVQEPCDFNFFTPEQLWILTSLGGNDYQFANISTTGCLDAHGPNADRTVVDTWPCSRISNQRWTFTSPKLVSAVGGRCLDIADGSLDRGGLAQIFHCTSNNSAQQFTIYFVNF